MAVNWDWNQRKGKIVFKSKDKDKNETITWNLYNGNCLGVLLREWKDFETGDDMYRFITFFNDKEHLEKMLGLKNNWKGIKEDLFKEWFDDFEIDKVFLDVKYKDNWDIARCFANAGYVVELYKGGE